MVRHTSATVIVFNFAFAIRMSSSLSEKQR
jgi:hypothetical protein